MSSAMAPRMPFQRFHRHRLIVCLSLVAVVGGGCLPSSLFPTEKAVLEGVWSIFSEDLNTELADFSLTFDEAGSLVSVTYRIGDAAEASDDDPTAFANIDDALITLNTSFSDNSFSMNGTLDANEQNIHGTILLVLTSGGTTIRISRGTATLARETAVQPDASVLAGTWRLVVGDTGISQLLLQFDGSGNASSVTSQIGRASTRIDTAPTGTTSVQSGAVAMDLSFRGTVDVRDTFVFSGSLAEADDLMTGTASLRLSSGDVTIDVEDQPLRLIRLTPPPTNQPVLEGTWEYAPDADATEGASTLTQLLLTFDSDDQPVRVSYRFDDEPSITNDNVSGSADATGGVVTVNAAFAGQVVLFSGVLNEDQTLMSGRITVQLRHLTDEVSIIQQPAILTKQ